MAPPIGCGRDRLGRGYRSGDDGGRSGGCGAARAKRDDEGGREDEGDPHQCRRWHGGWEEGVSPYILIGRGPLSNLL